MNIGLLLDMAASTLGDRVAIRDERRTLTFAELSRSVDGAASVIAARGAATVVFIGTNDAAFPVALLGAARAGVPIAPLNYRLGEAELTRQLDTLPSPLVLVDDEMPRPAGREARSTGTWVEECFAADVTPPLPGIDGDTIAAYLFTSGTSSAPKRAVLRHTHLTSYVINTVEFGAAAADDTALTSVPTYHIAGVGTILSNLYAGRRMRYLPNFTAERWLAVAREEHITSAMLVPTMLARIVDHLDGAPADVPSLRSLAYGGARIPAPLLERALEAFPGTGFVNAYGLTETSSTIAVLGPDDHREAATSSDPRVRGRLASAGRFVPGVEGEIRSADGELVPAGSHGQLWVRGPQVSGEYSGQSRVVDEDGWFPTGDKARIDADGYLYVEGRMDDTIIRGGENIAPTEIEDVIARHPDVRDVAVVGMPDEHWGERTVAVVVAAEGSSLRVEDVRQWARRHLRGSRTPDDVYFTPELPYTPTGKLLRRRLRSSLRTPTDAG